MKKHKVLNILNHYADQNSVAMERAIIETLVKQGLEVKRFSSGCLGQFVKLTEHNRKVLEAAGYKLERRLSI